MPIFQYDTDFMQDLDGIPTTQLLESIHQDSLRLRSVLNSLGNFWIEVFADYDLLETLVAGVNTLILTEYYKILENVLSASVLNIPVEHKTKYDLITFDREKAIYVYSEEDPNVLDVIRYPVPKYEAMEYLVPSLFNPKTPLIQGIHYTIEDEYICFNVDIFSDPRILNDTYQAVIGTGENGIQYARFVLMWATSVYLTDTVIYSRYSTFMYKEGVDADLYKEVTKALQYFFTNTKSLPRLESAINVLLGLPNSRVHNEIVTEISFIDSHGNPIDSIAMTGYTGYEESEVDFGGVSQYKVCTDYGNTYFIPGYIDLSLQVGGKLVGFEVLGSAYQANDYISKPDWYNGALFPWELVIDCNFKDVSTLVTFASPPIPSKPIPIYAYPNDYTLTEDDEPLPTYGLITTYLGPDTPNTYINKSDLATISGFQAIYSGNDAYNGKKFYSSYPSHLLRSIVRPYNSARPIKDSDNPTEQYLYSLMDNVLKDNIIYLKAALSFVSYYVINEVITDVFPYIKKGLPAYLYFLFDTVIEDTLKDDCLTLDLVRNNEDTQDIATFELSIKNEENYTAFSAGLRYDGIEDYGNTDLTYWSRHAYFLYDGSSNYDEAGNFYKSGMARKEFEYDLMDVTPTTRPIRYDSFFDYNNVLPPFDELILYKYMKREVFLDEIEILGENTNKDHFTAESQVIPLIYDGEHDYIPITATGDDLYFYHPVGYILRYDGSKDYTTEALAVSDSLFYVRQRLWSYDGFKDYMDDSALGIRDTFYNAIQKRALFEDEITILGESDTHDLLVVTVDHTPTHYDATQDYILNTDPTDELIVYQEMLRDVSTELISVSGDTGENDSLSIVSVFDPIRYDTKQIYVNNTATGDDLYFYKDMLRDVIEETIEIGGSSAERDALTLGIDRNQILYNARQEYLPSSASGDDLYFYNDELSYSAENEVGDLSYPLTSLKREDLIVDIKLISDEDAYTELLDVNISRRSTLYNGMQVFISDLATGDDLYFYQS